MGPSRPSCSSAATASLSSSASGNSPDLCVGKFLEFRIVRDPAQPDISQVPNVLIPNPDLSQVPVVAQRTFEFGRGANQNQNDPVTSFFGPWGVKTDGGAMLAADFGRISAGPSAGKRDIWTLRNAGYNGFCGSCSTPFIEPETSKFSSQLSA